MSRLHNFWNRLYEYDCTNDCTIVFEIINFQFEWGFREFEIWLLWSVQFIFWSQLYFLKNSVQNAVLSCKNLRYWYSCQLHWHSKFQVFECLVHIQAWVDCICIFSNSFWNKYPVHLRILIIGILIDMSWWLCYFI